MKKISGLALFISLLVSCVDNTRTSDKSQSSKSTKSGSGSIGISGPDLANNKKKNGLPSFPPFEKKNKEIDAKNISCEKIKENINNQEMVLDDLLAAIETKENDINELNIRIGQLYAYLINEEYNSEAYRLLEDEIEQVKEDKLTLESERTQMLDTVELYQTELLNLENKYNQQCVDFAVNSCKALLSQEETLLAEIKTLSTDIKKIHFSIGKDKQDVQVIKNKITFWEGQIEMYANEGLPCTDCDEQIDKLEMEIQSLLDQIQIKEIKKQALESEKEQKMNELEKVRADFKADCVGNDLICDSLKDREARINANIDRALAAITRLNQEYFALLSEKNAHQSALDELEDLISNPYLSSAAKAQIQQDIDELKAKLDQTLSLIAHNRFKMNHAISNRDKLVDERSINLDLKKELKCKL